MRIAVGSDHAGFQLKQAVLSFFSERGLEYQDFGCYDETSVDYPDIALPVAQAVAEGQFDHGILICSNGVGMSICANKVRGIRAALCSDTFSARRAREHTDANILCMGGLAIGPGLARELVQAYLDAAFLGGRHARRVEKIRALDEHLPETQPQKTSQVSA